MQERYLMRSPHEIFPQEDILQERYVMKPPHEIFPQEESLQHKNLLNCEVCKSGVIYSIVKV